MLSTVLLSLCLDAVKRKPGHAQRRVPPLDFLSEH